MKLPRFKIVVQNALAAGSFGLCSDHAQLNNVRGKELVAQRLVSVLLDVIKPS
jgi:hypothetical protein